MDSPHWGRHCMSSWSLSFHVSRFPDAHRKTTFCEHGTRTWPLSDAVCKRRGVDSSSVRTTVAKITRARSTISTHRRSPLVSTMAVAVALAEVLGSSALIGTRSAPRGRRPAAPAASHTAASRTAPSAQRRTLPSRGFRFGWVLWLFRVWRGLGNSSCPRARGGVGGFHATGARTFVSSPRTSTFETVQTTQFREKSQKVERYQVNGHHGLGLPRCALRLPEEEGADHRHLAGRHVLPHDAVPHLRVHDVRLICEQGLGLPGATLGDGQRLHLVGHQRKRHQRGDHGEWRIARLHLLQQRHVLVRIQRGV